MKDDSYYVIQSFMVNELGLSGNELILYAIVYGFTQDGVNWFYGTREYLSGCTNLSKTSVTRCLHALIDKGMIERREISDKTGKRVEYRALRKFTNHGKESCRRVVKKVYDGASRKLTMGGKESLRINNIEDNIQDNPKENIDTILVQGGDWMEYAFAYHCIAAWQNMTGKTAEHLPTKTMDYLQSQKDRYTIDEVKSMLQYKRDEWKGSDMEKNFYPSTLFKPEHFARYMNQSKDETAQDDELRKLHPEFFREPDFVFDE